MVILKNIMKNSDSISADYYPEGENRGGHMKLILVDGEIVSHENADDFSAVHVLYELRRLAKMENPPSEKTVLWY